MPDNYRLEYQRILVAMSLLQNVEDSDYTEKHSLRVGRIVKQMCEELEQEGICLNKEDCMNVIRAAYFHDVGKIKLSKKVLFKVGKLDEDEYEEMKLHPIFSREILKGMRLDEEARLVLNHHERLDGSGYPNGIKGDEFDLHSQIIAVADVYDAIITERPYKKGNRPADTLLHMYSLADKHFDLRIIKSLHRVLEKNRKVKKTLDI